MTVALILVSKIMGECTGFLKFEGIRFLTYGVGTVNTLALFTLLPLTVILLLVSWLFCRLCLPYIIERSLN